MGKEKATELIDEACVSNAEGSLASGIAAASEVEPHTSEVQDSSDEASLHASRLYKETTESAKHVLQGDDRASQNSNASVFAVVLLIAASIGALLSAGISAGRRPFRENGTLLLECDADMEGPDSERARLNVEYD